MRAAPRDQIDHALTFQAFGDLSDKIHRHAKYASARRDIKPLPNHHRNPAADAGRHAANDVFGVFRGSVHTSTHSHHQLEQLERDHREDIGDREPQRDAAGGDPPAELAFEFGDCRQTRCVGEHEQQERDRRGTPMAV